MLHGAVSNVKHQIGHFRAPLCLSFKASLSAKTILVKMTLSCMKMKLHAELIFI